jgi:hypothetical protein
MSDAVSVQSDRLVFDAPVVSSSLKARITSFDHARQMGVVGADDVILMGDRAKDAVNPDGSINEKSNNPYGFMRRAVSYTEASGKVVVMTEPISLEEAFQNFNNERVIAFGSSPGNSALHYNIPVINLADKQLFSSGDFSVKLKSANVTIDATVDLGANISWFSLQDAHVVLDATIDSQAVVEADLSGAFQKSFSNDVYTNSWAIGSIGPVPVSLGLIATVACDINADGAASASVGLGMNIHAKGGVQYDSTNGTAPVWETPRFSPRVVPPTFNLDHGSTTTRCAIRPQLAIKLFDAGGPTLTPDLAARLQASTPPVKATVTGELGADVGGRLDVFGKNLGAVNYHLFTVDKQLWSTN